ncbi:MAG: hypothetical protein LBS60_09935 [Deltaproteobacteria bacterium]|nr:hypothetical protein [Deltaproteobacteria bacterium]
MARDKEKTVDKGQTKDKGQSLAKKIMSAESLEELEESLTEMAKNPPKSSGVPLAEEDQEAIIAFFDLFKSPAKGVTPFADLMGKLEKKLKNVPEALKSAIEALNSYNGAIKSLATTFSEIQSIQKLLELSLEPLKDIDASLELGRQSSQHLKASADGALTVTLETLMLLEANVNSNALTDSKGVEPEFFQSSLKTVDSWLKQMESNLKALDSKEETATDPASDVLNEVLAPINSLISELQPLLDNLKEFEKVFHKAIKSYVDLHGYKSTAIDQMKKFRSIIKKSLS